MYNDVEYGSAMHHFLEGFLSLPANERNNKYIASMLAAQDYFKNKPMLWKPTKNYLNVEHLNKSCFHFVTGEHHKLTEYWEPLINPLDNKPMLEVKFAIPYFSNEIMDIVLCGTIDAVMQSKRNPNLIAVCDFKTSSARDSAEYLGGYTISSQLMMYVYALKYYISRGEGDFWSGLSDRIVGAFIFALFPQAPSTKGSNVTPIKCEQSNLFIFNDEQLKEFAMLLSQKATRISTIVNAYHTNESRRTHKEGALTGYCQQQFGSNCPYFGACCAPDDDAMFSLLEAKHKKSFYDPRTFGGGQVKKEV
jgi:hypothetical protein